MPDIRDKPLRYRELLSILRKFGKPAFVPIHPHSENHEFSRKVIRSVRERFGISIEDFYSK